MLRKVVGQRGGRGFTFKRTHVFVNGGEKDLGINRQRQCISSVPGIEPLGPRRQMLDRFNATYLKRMKLTHCPFKHSYPPSCHQP